MTDTTREALKIAEGWMKHVIEDTEWSDNPIAEAEHEKAKAELAQVRAALTSANAAEAKPEPVRWAITVGPNFANIIGSFNNRADADAAFEEHTKGYKYADIYQLHELYAALPAPVDAQIDRDAVIEMCAKVCDQSNEPDDWTEYAKTKAQCAAAIRAMKGTANAAQPQDVTLINEGDMQPIKDHVIAQTVNELMQIARDFHGTKQLRERIAHVVVPLLRAAQPASGAIDQRALDTAKKIMGAVRGPTPKGGDSQLLAGIQCAVIDALNFVRPVSGAVDDTALLNILDEIDNISGNYDHDQYGLPLHDSDTTEEMVKVLRAALSSNQVNAAQPTDWTVCHNGKSVTSSSLAKAMAAARFLRTEEETRIAAENVMRAIDEEIAYQEKDAELIRLREISRLIGSIYAFGNFKAETHNERELEKLLREQGTFWSSIAEYEAAIAAKQSNDNQGT